MQGSRLQSLLNKAKSSEKKYEWLQAADVYSKVIDLVEEKDVLKAAEFEENMGFCFYKAAFQAQDNKEFRKRLEQAMLAYEKEIKLLEKTKQKSCHSKSDHAHALLAYTQSWHQTNPEQKKELLSKWWVYENRVLAEYETAGDFYSIGKTCNDLMEYSNYDRMWLVSNYSELEEYSKQGIILAEKAIKALIKTNDLVELTRAYFMASWFYSWSDMIWASEQKVMLYLQKCQDYANKAIELALKTDDAWLISWSYIIGWGLFQFGQLDPVSAIEYSKKVLNYGKIARDKFLIGMGYFLEAFSSALLAKSLEDPDKQKENFRKIKALSQKAIENTQIIQLVANATLCNMQYGRVMVDLTHVLSNIETKQLIFENAIEALKKGLRDSKGWNRVYGMNFHSLSVFVYLLAETKNDIKEKRQLLQQSESFLKEFIDFMNGMFPFYYLVISEAYYKSALVKNALAGIETDDSNKVELLNEAIVSIEKSVSLVDKKKKVYIQSKWANGYYYGRYYNKLGEIFRQIYLVSQEKKLLEKSIEAYIKTAHYYTIAETPTYVAESYWQIAQLYNEIGNFQAASKYYELASGTYDLVAKKIPQLEDFSKNHSLYMQAWGQIEQARYNHSIEDYQKAKQCYEKAAELHKSTSSWSYLAPNYFAWAKMEEAEGFSRKEKTEQAKHTFQEALKQFSLAEQSIKQKLEEITSEDEKNMIDRLLKASDLRGKYCKTRILIEEAKLLDKEGKHRQSSRNYEKVAQSISIIVEKIDFDSERKELKYVAILCQAWGKMAIAEETSSAESYLEAAEFFEQAKDYCFTKKASLWAIANSSFCKGLAAGTRYQDSMDLKENALAKRHMKQAAANYQQAGFKSASEYAMATQRLFDAYIFMNQAEGEVDPEKRAKQYQMAENLLQIAAGSFMKAKQPEKTNQVQQILVNVKQEKALALSLNQVMQAPSIASSTLSFAAPSPTTESSVGLENFEHANVQANLITTLKQVNVGESFYLSVEFVNAGREPALLMRVDDFIPQDFIVVKKPEIYRIEETTLNMKGKQLAPLKLVEVKLTMQPSKKGNYSLNPRVHYLNELGQNKSLQLKTVEIKVEEVILENRTTTGTEELDSLLLGGIPTEYAVVLSSSPCDERELIVNNFLSSGVEDGISFYVTTEANELADLLDNPNFFLFLCNPKPKVEVPDLPNVFKLQGKTDLNNLGIALTKAYRSVDQSVTSKRICIEILSEVLEDYGSNTTRKWISDLITNYGAKGFTLLAVMYPEMHQSEESKAVLSLFDGEISIIQSDDPLDCKKSILVKKLRNQDYIKNPICLR